MENLLKLTKKKLEELGREKGIELDRRKSKAALVEELEDYLCKCGKTEDENGLCDGSHAKQKVQEETEVIYEFVPANDRHSIVYDYKQILNTEFETEGAAKVITFQYGGKVVSKESKFVVVK
jgi:CDGSH-type Zn-finger protein